LSIRNIIAQLKRLPIFNGNVIGAAEFVGLQNQVFTRFPVAVVMPYGDKAEDNDSMTALFQFVSKQIAIDVIFSNVDAVQSGNDNRGQATAQQFDQVEFSIFRAILNWNPYSLIENPNLPDQSDPVIGHAIKGFQFVECGRVEYDLARYIYRWIFSIPVQITDQDGWQATGTPLEEIFLTVSDPDTGDTLGGADLTGLENVGVPLAGVESRAEVGSFTIV
jgi:hypothetical protein